MEVIGESGPPGAEGAADRRDYDSAGASYSALTSSCFGCHKHVMNVRIAKTN